MTTQSFINGFWNIVWPATRPTDSELLRRKKLVVRTAQMAVAAIVIVPVTSAIIAGLDRSSPAKLAMLALLSLIYIAWNWKGMRYPVGMLLGEPEITPAAGRKRDFSFEVAFYFMVQLTLAGLICYQSFYGRERPIAWLVLLPPVAHSVILLGRWGVATVSTAILILFLFSVVSHLGWQMATTALLAFSFALLFTLVFTFLAVSSEKARQEVTRLAEDLATANEKLRQYAVQAEELATTRERNRLAGEIHDSLGHYLTVVNVQIEAARALQHLNPEGANAALAKAQSLTLEGLQEIRRSVATLRATPLNNRPLLEALQQVVAENCAAGLQTKLEVLGENRRLSPQAELTLYRATQEGLTNVRKHAKTNRARVSLDFQAASQVVLSVSDPGIGGAGGAAGSTGFGLLGLRERVQLLGGNIHVLTTPAKGFTLQIEVPG